MNQKPEQKEFFVGWENKLPSGQAAYLRKAIWGLGLLAGLVAVALVLSQRGFADSVFEFGNLKTIEGVLIQDPFPMLKVLKTNSSPMEPSFERILLIGFGKKGAGKTLDELEELHGPLWNKPIRLEGTLIYDQGKTALELTNGAASYKGLGNKDIVYPKPEMVEKGRHRLVGEILDPKCALGVMKPAFGKPHKSCAIRCISGGIPPVLRIQEDDGTARHFLVTGPGGQAVNQEILPFVADQVRICGELSQVDDWEVIRVDPAKDILRLSIGLFSGTEQTTKIPMCQN